MSTFSTDYSPALEDRSLAQVKGRYQLFIDGEFVDAAAGKVFRTEDPSTGERLAVVADAGPADVDAAVQAANAALGPWASLPGSVRARYLFTMARLMVSRARELAVLESLDNGKPIRETRDFDVPTAAQHFFHYAGWADKLEHAALSDTRPVGVCAQVIPWNFPLLMAAWKVAPALAAGCTVVLKPAETTPLSALVLAEIAAQAGLPAGVLNVVTGDGATGAALVEHPDVDKVAFTGSTDVGRRIATAVAGTHKRLTLELGGKSANIVFDDASLPAAVEGVVAGIFFNQGHVCCAGSRLLVAEPVAERFVDMLSARMEQIRVGAPLDKNTDMGAINSPEQLARITEIVADAASSGVEVRSVDVELPGRGSWFAPTLLCGVEPAHRAARAEIFGPVLSVMTFRTPAEAVERANDSTYGLAAGVWTENGSLSRWVANHLRAGVVWANTYNRFDPTSPFGGFRESGYGREGGRHGLECYVGPTGRKAKAAKKSPTSRKGAQRSPRQAIAAAPGTSAAATVVKTPKMFVGGAFVRSESGATVQVELDGTVVEVPSASRKDARDAVTAATGGFSKWSSSTPYLRGQVLYRVAEMAAARVDLAGVADAADRWIHWAGWCDKLGHTFGTVNDVSAPFDSVSAPVPVGVVAVVVPSGATLAEFADLVGAPLAAGASVVSVVDPADVDLVTFAEVFATSDLPVGAVNVLSSSRPEVTATLAAHSGVAAVDLAGAGRAAAELEVAAAQNLLRVRRPAASPSPLARLRLALDVRTIWHPATR